jgi:hypothetical protein
MAEPEHRSQNSVPSDNHHSFSRRNLPRASHACQRCRAKKAKCDQQQPCASCVKHSCDCVYGIRRRNGKSRNSRARSPDRRELVDRHDHIRSPASIRASQDEPSRSENLEHTHISAQPRTYKSITQDFTLVRMLLNIGRSLCTPVSTR